MSGLLIVSDPHGCLKTLLALVDKHGRDRQLILLGDLIDRGVDSRGIVEYAMKNRIPTCMGNHEHLCVDYHLNQLTGDKSDYQDGIWLMNGAIEALKSWGRIREMRLPTIVVAWMQSLPLTIQLPEYPELLLSHTGHGLITPDSQHTPFDAVWARSTKFPKDGLFRVFGHTPHVEPEEGEGFINIDTGCAYGQLYGNKLTGYLYPEREIVQMPNLDPKP